MSNNIKAALDSVKESYENGEVEGNEYSAQAMEWYGEQLHIILKGELTSISSLIKETPEYRVKKVFLGKMYTFGYLPETPIAKMKYYDRFPLAVPIKFFRDHFMGVNLHFIPFPMRAVFLENVTKIVSGDIETGDARAAALRYELIKFSTKYMSGIAAIRKYKYDNIYTPTLQIPSDKWKYAINLPTARFYGTNGGFKQAVVMRDSVMKIRKFRNRNP